MKKQTKEKTNNLRADTLSFYFKEFSKFHVAEQKILAEKQKLEKKLQEVGIKKEISYKKYRNEILECLKLKNL